MCASLFAFCVVGTSDWAALGAGTPEVCFYMRWEVMREAFSVSKCQMDMDDARCVRYTNEVLLFFIA